MKKPFLYVGSVLIFILAAVAFIFVPARAGNSRAENAVVFGKYDGKPIEYKPNSVLALNIDRYERMAKAQGQNIEGFTWFYIYTYAFRDTINEIARATFVKKSGYEPSDKAVARATLALPYFLDENGKYSQTRYEAISEDSREELRKNIKDSLIVQRFDYDMLGTSNEIGGTKLYGLKLSDEEISFILSMGEKRRSFDVVSFDKSLYPDSEIFTFAEENRSLFDKFDLSAISFKDEQTAKQVASQLSGNALEFKDALGEEYSEKYYTDADGKITASYRYQIKGILSDESALSSLDSLSEGSFSDAIQTSSGWTIFRKDGKTTEPDFGKADAIDFSAITFDSQDLASSVRERLSDGSLTISSVLNGAGKKTYTDNDGKLNAKTISEATNILSNKDDAKNLSELSKDDWSSPIKTAEGWTIFRKDGEVTRTDSFDVAKRYVTSNESGRIEDYFIARAKDFSAAATLSGFESAAAQFKEAETNSVSGISLNYGGTSISSKLPENVKPLASASSNENFWTKAFSLKNGELSEPMVLGNYVVALKMTGEETVTADESKISALKTDIAGFDSDSLSSAISESKKVEDNVWDAYARLHM